jgi:hypothetical protein
MLKPLKCTLTALILSTAAEAAPPPQATATATLTAAPAPNAQAIPVASAATTTSTEWPITVNVQLDVSKVDPSNSTVGLNCEAILDTQHDVTANNITSGPVDAATYHKDIEMHPQGWPSRRVSVGAAMVNGEYHGVQSVTFKFNPAQAALQGAGSGPLDTVVVGCRLTLNNLLAIMNPYSGLTGPSSPLEVTSGAIAFVQTHAIEWQTQ